MNLEAAGFVKEMGAGEEWGGKVLRGGRGRRREAGGKESMRSPGRAWEVGDDVVAVGD